MKLNTTLIYNLRLFLKSCFCKSKRKQTFYSFSSDYRTISAIKKNNYWARLLFFVFSHNLKAGTTRSNRLFYLKMISLGCYGHTDNLIVWISRTYGKQSNTLSTQPGWVSYVFLITSLIKISKSCRDVGLFNISN